ncbi:MAG: hypothetical protein N838_11760 [Thiohalocapsa sp. PB-PSB1]|jgi:hypothetical protein|nr:MAG: hypothetical protein N838_11760 [Thiohalocapsa sp. PB-PSB1]HCS90377.1 hypothetical protein [Chromatiaceae bacterium]
MNSGYLILYHKQSTSARTRFLRHGHGGICGIDALPEDALLDPTRGDDDSTLTTHPGMLLRNAENRLKLPRGSLESDLGFRCRVVADDTAGDVHLAHFVSIDPPFEAAHHVGAAFIDLTQARGLPSTELELLRLAYEHVLG